jgi:hypothetical protein
MAREDEIISFVKDRFGPVLDLNERPRELIDIIRRFAGDLFKDDDPGDGGLAPGGVPEPPPPPPGPDSMKEGPTNGELMKEILKLSQQVAALEQRVGGG